MICAEFTASSPKLARKTTALNWRPDLPHAEQRKNATRFCRGRCEVFDLLETGPSSMDSVAIATGQGSPAGASDEQLPSVSSTLKGLA